MEPHQKAAAGAGIATTLGQRLQAAREARGLQLTDIAAATRVRLRHLASIEADAHENLPAIPYTAGFVRAYAKTVGLPADELVAQFRRETSKAVTVPQLPDPPIDAARVPPRALAIASLLAVLLIVGAVLAFGLDWFGGSARPASEQAPQIATAADPEPEVAGELPEESDEESDELAAAGAPGPAAGAVRGVPPAAAGGEVVLRAKEDVWLKVYDGASGETVKMGIMPAGEAFQLPPRDGLLLWTGRAGALEVTVGGRRIPPLGGPAQTVRDVSLAPADLLARSAG